MTRKLKSWGLSCLFKLRLAHKRKFPHINDFPYSEILISLRIRKPTKFSGFLLPYEKCYNHSNHWSGRL